MSEHKTGWDEFVAVVLHKQETFTANDVVQLLSIGETTARKYIKSAVTNNQIAATSTRGEYRSNLFGSEDTVVVDDQPTTAHTGKDEPIVAPVIKLGEPDVTVIVSKNKTTVTKGEDDTTASTGPETKSTKVTQVGAIRVEGPKRKYTYHPKPVVEARDAKVYEAIDGAGPISRNELVEELGLPASEVYLSIYRLRKSGAIERVSIGATYPGWQSKVA